MIQPINGLYAKKLRSLRLQNDYQQKALAELIGLKSQQDYSKLENGKKHFTEKIISKICEVFNVDVEVFKNTNAELKEPLAVKMNRETETKLIKALEDEITSTKIMALYRTKNHLEQELKIINELIAEKLSKKYMFHDTEKGKVYLCTFH